MLATIAFPAYFWGWSAYICFVPVLIMLNKEKKLVSVFFRSWLFGLVFMLIFHRWMWTLKAWAPWPGVLLLWFSLSLYLSFFYGAAAAMYLAFKRKISNAYVLNLVLFPALFTLAELFRSLGPLGNLAGALGYSQTVYPQVLQLASLFGLYGLSFFIFFINGALFLVLSEPRKKQTLAIAALASLMVLGWGYYRLSNHPFASDLPPLKVAVIQPNFPQADKMTPEKWPAMRQALVAQTHAIKTEKPGLVFWPETILPALNLKSPTFMKALEKTTRSLQAPVLFGTPIYHEKKFYNAICVMTPEGLSANNYKKTRLMPFGEYLPLRQLFTRLKLTFLFLPEDYHAGSKAQLIPVNTIKIGAGICLESVFPNHFSDVTKKGAHVLYVAVNNAWFFNSVAAAEHLQMSQLRAVENGRYLIQSANTGISAIIHPNGQLVDTLSLDKKDVLQGVITPLEHLTFYTRYPNLIIWICLGLLLLSLGYSDKKNKRKPTTRHQYYTGKAFRQNPLRR